MRIILFFIVCSSMLAPSHFVSPDQKVRTYNGPSTTLENMLEIVAFPRDVKQVIYQNDGKGIVRGQYVDPYNEHVYDNNKKHVFYVLPAADAGVVYRIYPGKEIPRERIDEVTPFDLEVDIFGDGTMVAKLQITSLEMQRRFVHKGCTIVEIARHNMIDPTSTCRFLSLNWTLPSVNGYLKLECKFEKSEFTHELFKLFECWHCDLAQLQLALDGMSQDELDALKADNPLEKWIKMLSCEECDIPTPNTFTDALHRLPHTRCQREIKNKIVPWYFDSMHFSMTQNSACVMLKVYQPGGEFAKRQIVIDLTQLSPSLKKGCDLYDALECMPGIRGHRIHEGSIVRHDGTPAAIMEPGNFYSLECEKIFKQDGSSFTLYDKDGGTPDIRIPTGNLFARRPDLMKKITEVLCGKCPGKLLYLETSVGVKIPLNNDTLPSNNLLTQMIIDCKSKKGLAYGIIPEKDDECHVNSYPFSVSQEPKFVHFSVSLGFPIGSLLGMKVASVAHLSKKISSLTAKVGKSYFFFPLSDMLDDLFFNERMLLALRAIEKHSTLFDDLTRTEGIVEGFNKFFKVLRDYGRTNVICGKQALRQDRFGLLIIESLRREALLKQVLDMDEV